MMAPFSGFAHKFRRVRFLVGSQLVCFLQFFSESRKQNCKYSLTTFRSLFFIFLPFRRKQRGRFFLDFSPSSSSLHKENGIENRNIFLLFVCRKPKRITDNNKIENTEQSPSLPHISTHWENVIILDGAHLDSFLYSPFLMLRKLGKGRKK